MSRDDSTDLQKEVTHLRLRLHHAENAVHYFSIEAKSFESKWLMALDENESLRREVVEKIDENEQLRKDLVQMRQTSAEELQATREDLDRANETLAKLFKSR